MERTTTGIAVGAAATGIKLFRSADSARRRRSASNASSRGTVSATARIHCSAGRSASADATLVVRAHCMSERGATITVLATQLAEAVGKDEAEPDGFDISAGLFGPHVSAWVRSVADELIRRSHGDPKPKCQMTARKNWYRDEHPCPFPGKETLDGKLMCGNHARSWRHRLALSAGTLT